MSEEKVIVRTYILTYVVIELAELPVPRKTSMWHVYAKAGRMFLGTIKWYGAWRGYALFPEGNTIFEQKCLREIADFIEKKSREHHETQRKDAKASG
jgi:hypothetical protein